MSTIITGVNISNKTDLEQLKNNGFNCVELFTKDSFKFDFNDEILRKIKENGFYSVIHLPHDIDLHKQDDKQLFYFNDYIKLAKTISCDKLVLHADLDITHNNEKSDLNIVKKNLEKIVDILNHQNIKLCLENDEPYTDLEDIQDTTVRLGYDISSYYEKNSIYDKETKQENISRYIDLIRNVDGLYATFDVGHGNILTEDICDFYDKIKDKVLVIHLHDNRGIKDDHLQLGKGSIDFDKFANVCKKNSFNGPFIFENKSYEMIKQSKQYFIQKLEKV
ncbi:MAG: sugar phosphate isomerase/epimerase [Nanoarchaeota archaeon]|nr:sugar phosphate isomerase/epimerase [Nanoarchaeota archaeon]MBU1030770.1 sugar phosphate isomerase/epimerase [Nanoarchaeota archaeon]MBU1849911.1 sugar phosphate isomerase/epimerase [Nanoarchaeota archaeon]